MSNLVPVVVEQTSRGERSFDAREILRLRALVDEILSGRRVLPVLDAVNGG